MKWLGKNEEELKKWQGELDSREMSLNEMSRNLNQKEADLHHLDQLQSSRGEELAKKDAEVGTREHEIIVIDSANKHLNLLNSVLFFVHEYYRRTQTQSASSVRTS